MTEPTKPKKQIRDKSIKIRLTEIELEQFKQRQVGDELASWVRNICLGNPPQPLKETKKQTIKTADPELLRQLAKIGGNLNQIAKQINTVDNPIEKIRAFGYLAQIQAQLDELLERNQ